VICTSTPPLTFRIAHNTTRAHLPTTHPLPLTHLPTLLPMHQPSPTKIIRHPTPTPRNSLALERPTKRTKRKQQHQTNPKHNSKRPPIIANGEFSVLELDGKVSRHERHGRKEDCDFGEQESHPCESLHAERFFDGNEVEVHHDQTILLRETLINFTQCVQKDSILEALEADFGGRAEGHAEEAVGFWNHGARGLVGDWHFGGKGLGAGHDA
jgi:hypothetical protein